MRLAFVLSAGNFTAISSLELTDTPNNIPLRPGLLQDIRKFHGQVSVTVSDRKLLNILAGRTIDKHDLIVSDPDRMVQS